MDNWVEEPLKAQGRVQDKGAKNMKDWVHTNPELKVISYDKKLSHWQAKNAGVRLSTGKYLWFCDGHCVVYSGSVARLFHAYRGAGDHFRGTLHLPISYLLDAPGRSLIYKLTGNFEKGEIHYSFTRYRDATEPYAVPCMSTCGMMMRRDIYDALGGWPEELGIYGGGENFINFVLATLGYSVNIMPGPPLYHYAEKRGYNWNFDDYLRNRMVATYMYGGYPLLKLFTEHSKGNPIQKQKIMESVITSPSARAQMEMLEGKRVIPILDWIRHWRPE